MIERLFTPCPCTKTDDEGWEFVESDSDYWRPCTDCSGTLRIKESDADYIERLHRVIDWLAGHNTNESTWANYYVSLDIKAARLKAAVEATK